MRPLHMRCSPLSLAVMTALCVLVVGISTVRAGELGTLSIAPPVSDGCVGDVGNLNNPSCTANDVRLTAIVDGTLVLYGNCSGSGALCQDNAGCPSGQTCDGKGCTSAAGDTVTFSATGQFVAGPQRYDVGLYISTDSDADGNGAKFGTCTRFAFSNAELTNIDNDSCGDVNAGSTNSAPFGPVTIQCIDNGHGQVDIEHCETWAQRTNEINCTGSASVRAGTGSKCYCGVLAGACIAIDDGSDCTRDVCQGTCQTSTGGGSHTVCEDNSDCPASGEACRSITLQHIGNTSVECRPSAGACDLPETCAADGSCPADAFKASTVECRAQNGVCDVAESCTGTSADCPTDSVQPSTVVCRVSDGSSCDPAEFCDGTTKNCPSNVCLGNISHP